MLALGAERPSARFHWPAAVFLAKTEGNAGRQERAMALQKEFNFRALMTKDEEGRYRLATGDEIIEAAMSEMNRRFARGTAITDPGKTKEFLQLRLSHLEHEVFAVLWLDNRHRVLAFEELFRGTIDGASVHPREVVKSALQQNAAACILAHNHPSGVGEPSQADHKITQRLKDALNLVDVRVLDHIIVAENICSFAERGLI
jgi:DNA repair protein RadC